MKSNFEFLKKYWPVLPPYQEQIRIAERIDELFALLVAIEKSLISSSIHFTLPLANFS